MCEVNGHKTCAVVLATYNGQKYIQDQLSSILTQTRPPDYILVTDDGSKDKTIQMCENMLRNTNIFYKIVRNQYPVGVTKNFIKAAEDTNEDVVLFCDQDDIWVNNKIEKMMGFFENYRDCKEVISDAWIWKANNIRKGTKKTGSKLLDLQIPLPKYDSSGLVDISSFWKVTIERNIATGMCQAISRDVINEGKKILENVLERTEYSLIMFHDSYYNLVAGAIGEVYIVREPLVYYRQHKNNVQGINHRINSYIIKRGKSRVSESFKRFREKQKLIEYIDNNYSCLSETNRNILEDYKVFYNQRKFDILNHNTRKILVEKKKYNMHGISTKLWIRDVFISSISSNI